MSVPSSFLSINFALRYPRCGWPLPAYDLAGPNHRHSTAVLPCLCWLVIVPACMVQYGKSSAHSLVYSVYTEAFDHTDTNDSCDKSSLGWRQTATAGKTIWWACITHLYHACTISYMLYHIVPHMLHILICRIATVSSLVCWYACAWIHLYRHMQSMALQFSVSLGAMIYATVCCLLCWYACTCTYMWPSAMPHSVLVGVMIYARVCL